MPKDTFFNLNEEKRENIIEVLKDEFTNKPFKDVSVKTIVDRLGIARGSFYQYFEDIKDFYFYILDKETHDIHLLFMKIFIKNNEDIFSSLENYGKEVSEIIFKEDKYNIYKNRYLYWNEDLNTSWNLSKKDHYSIFYKNAKNFGVEMELIHFMKSIVHSLIERNFREGWNKETFLKKYNTYINWIKKGVIE